MHQSASSLLAAAAAIMTAPLASAEILSYTIPQVGQSRSYFMGADNPLVGGKVVSARIYITVDSFVGSDAANFYTDHSFPILPDAGNESAWAFLGSDHGWTGAGRFEYFLETTMFNGEIVPSRFGSETPGFDFDGQVVDGSRIEFDVVTVPAPASAGLLITGGLLAARRRRA